MFVREFKEPVKLHGTRYTPGIGDRPVVLGWVEQTFQLFQCNHCGHQPKILIHNGETDLGKTTEPFYCRECQHLISIDGVQ